MNKLDLQRKNAYHRHHLSFYSEAISFSMSTSPLVSVIVPVYNAESDLRDTLDSIQNQTLHNIEIICVDDGSTDLSPAILSDYALRDNRFRILTQKNQYAGVARNNGMNIARGKYLSFLDSDDLFEPDMLQKLVNQAEKTLADIVICGYDQFHEQNKSQRIPQKALNVPLPPKINPDNFTPSRDLPADLFRFASPTPWNKLFRSDFVRQHQLTWSPTRCANDLEFVYYALFLAKHVSILNQSLIHYRIRSKSISHVRRNDTSIFYLSHGSLYRRIHAHSAPAETLRALDHFCLSGFFGSAGRTNAEGAIYLRNTYLNEYAADFRFLEKGREYFNNKHQFDIIASYLYPDITLILQGLETGDIRPCLDILKQDNSVRFQILCPIRNGDLVGSTLLHQYQLADPRFFPIEIPTEATEEEELKICRKYAWNPIISVIPPGMQPASSVAEMLVDIRRGKAPSLRTRHKASFFYRRKAKSEEYGLPGIPIISIYHHFNQMTFRALGYTFWTRRLL